MSAPSGTASLRDVGDAMDSERLRPLPDDLFDEASPTSKAALDKLREHLLRIGFRVNKRAPRERTLRVYLDEGIDYPLLNPRITTIYANVDADGEPLDDEVYPVISIAIFSNGDAEIDERLREFPSGDGRVFVPHAADDKSKGYHGAFVVDLPLIEVGGSEEVDFPTLVADFRLIRRFLLGEDIPVPRSDDNLNSD
jgi:hypothetical protein